MNVVSPTGTIHAIETDYSLVPDIVDDYKDFVTTKCHYSPGVGYGRSWIDAYDVDWPKTNKPITCKSCLAVIEREQAKVMVT